MARARIEPDFAAGLEQAADLFAEAGSRDVFDGAAWYRTFAQSCLDVGDEALLASAEGAALPLRRLSRSALFPGALHVASLSNFYTCSFRPLLASSDAGAGGLGGLLDALITLRADIITLDSLPVEEPGFAALETGLRARGLIVRRYFHFGTWWEQVGGDFEAYMARRPSRLRNTVQRRRRRLERQGDVSFEVIRDADRADAAIAAYQQVYRHSWKEPEPHADFIATLVREMAAAGHLRLGICWLAGEPAACQIWLCAGPRATIFKLAYDERHREKSLGTVLTAEMMQHAILRDGVREVDFGRGDDPYKRDWLGERREFWGLAAFQPRRPRGLMAAIRHAWLPALRPGRPGRSGPAVDPA